MTALSLVRAHLEEAPVVATHVPSRSSRFRSVLPYLAATALVLPLFAPEVWTGFRLALANNVLAAIAATEQPLSVRSPGGQWAIGLALTWFALAYWRKSAPWWQCALVVLGASAALLRNCNAWLDGIALIAPLGAQVARLRVKPQVLGGVFAAGVVVAAATLWSTRPPGLPEGAVEAAESARGSGNVFADWRWAPELQRNLDRKVLASGGLGSESSAFWLDYVRVSQDYEHWPTELRDLNVDLLVLNTDQSTVANQVRVSSDWHVIYDAGDALVAERAGT